MSASVLVHAAVFGVGAAVGVGVASNYYKRQQVAVPPPPAVVQAHTGATRSSISDYNDVLKFGNPGPISDVLPRKAYTAGYDRRLRHSAWTAEHLTPASLGRGGSGSGASPKGDRGRSVFTEDESVPFPFRARLADYFHSGYDRGHMVPAADAKLSQEAMDETFLLSNIAPQVGVGFNRHYWAYVEDWCRRLTSSFSDVYVFTVPLYLPRLDTDGKWRVSYEMIGSPPNVGVPTHFAKVVLASKPASPSNPTILEMSMGAFVIPNAVIPDETPLESFVVSVDAVERAAGLAIFPEQLKRSARPICQSASCKLIIRRFDDAQKQVQGLGQRNFLAPPGPKSS